ncbi:GIY-YIG nuclease family protein, partial [Burkholderia cenocepacia]|uniref:GIY-YIG nuclease family protein n=1 Tax=Burkholderia cenocepacia TaxID=95486 RepID=UPI0024B63D2E
MSWFLYLIECADDSVYTGITTDVAARFDEHASGKGARLARARVARGARVV